MTHDLGQRYQFVPVPLRSNYGSLDAWADALAAALNDNYATLSEEPLVPVTYTTATSAITLTTSMQELSSIMQAFDAEVHLLFNCIVSVTMATAIRELTLRIQRDGSDIF